ncbi:hypothetical protein KCV07_g436, partial [Aureobasidium melanogenum]
MLSLLQPLNLILGLLQLITELITFLLSFSYHYHLCLTHLLLVVGKFCAVLLILIHEFVEILLVLILEFVQSLHVLTLSLLLQYGYFFSVASLDNPHLLRQLLNLVDSFHKPFAKFDVLVRNSRGICAEFGVSDGLLATSLSILFCGFGELLVCLELPALELLKFLIMFVLHLLQLVTVCLLGGVQASTEIFSAIVEFLFGNLELLLSFVGAFVLSVALGLVLTLDLLELHGFLNFESAPCFTAASLKLLLDFADTNVFFGAVIKVLFHIGVDESVIKGLFIVGATVEVFLIHIRVLAGIVDFVFVISFVFAGKTFAFVVHGTIAIADNRPSIILAGHECVGLALRHAGSLSIHSLLLVLDCAWLVRQNHINGLSILGLCVHAFFVFSNFSESSCEILTGQAWVGYGRKKYYFYFGPDRSYSCANDEMMLVKFDDEECGWVNLIWESPWYH